MFVANTPMVANSSSRPATAIGRVIEKISNGSAFAGLGSSFCLDRTSHPDAHSPIMAYNLQLKIARVIKLEDKAKLIKMELVEEFDNWAKVVSNHDMSTMLSEFSSLLLQVTDCSSSITEKLHVLKLNLADVHEREKKRKNLVTTKNRIVKQLKESESKFGADASGSLLLKEGLEESNCTLEVVEMQYLRSINKNLKEALVEYVTTLQIVAGQIHEATDNFYRLLLKLEEKPVIEKKATFTKPKKNYPFDKKKEKPRSEAVDVNENVNENDITTSKILSQLPIDIEKYGNDIWG